MTRLISTALLGLAMVASPCAADTVLLPPGKPAGVKQAEIYVSPTVFVMGVLALAGVGVFLASVKSPTSTAATTGTGS